MSKNASKPVSGSRNLPLSPYLCPALAGRAGLTKYKQVATKFSKETYLYWYELMQLIRQFELMAEEKY